jgi:intracellular sulfur oxidation DsrE/DsrF family protein
MPDCPADGTPLAYDRRHGFEQRRNFMTDIDRRHLIGALAAGSVALAGARPATATAPELKLSDLKKETDIACLYHCDFSDDGRYDAMLRNINNHLSAHDFDPFAVKIVIVALGPGIKYHLSSLAGTPWEKTPTIDPDLEKRMAGLAQYGVEVYLCRLTFELMGLDLALAKAVPYIKFVPSGVATIASLQSKGYGYLKVG